MNYRFVISGSGQRGIVRVEFNSRIIVVRVIPHVRLPDHEGTVDAPAECLFVRNAGAQPVARLIARDTRYELIHYEALVEEVSDVGRVFDVRCWRQSMQVTLLRLEIVGAVTLVGADAAG